MSQVKSTSRRQTRAKASTLDLPSVTEHDLLAFQISHFGDALKPVNWFIGAEEALNYHTASKDDGDDLGYYADGVPRTLTDDQIQIFRQSELWKLELERRRVEEEAAAAKEDEGRDCDRSGEHLVREKHPDGRNDSPAATKSKGQKDQTPAIAEPSKRNSSDGAVQKGNDHSLQQGIPYEQRHKRRWEQYICDQDAVAGSRTHRRIARELDDCKQDAIDMDY